MALAGLPAHRGNRSANSTANRLSAGFQSRMGIVHARRRYCAWPGRPPCRPLHRRGKCDDCASLFYERLIGNINLCHDCMVSVWVAVWMIFFDELNVCLLYLLFCGGVLVLM